MTDDPEEFPSPVGMLVLQDIRTGIRYKITAVGFTDQGDLIHIKCHILGSSRPALDTKYIFTDDLPNVSIIGIVINDEDYLVHRKMRR